jgi:hypothetical protein
MLEFGEPFINLNGIYKTCLRELSALATLACYSGHTSFDVIDVVDKAILLLNRKANISCRDASGDTVLHTLLKCERYYERMSKITARRHSGLHLHHWRMSFKVPKDLLKVFISAGADVYATNDNGQTPSMVASEYGRMDEWIEALELCGYEYEEVLKSCIHHPSSRHQTSKLSFQEYCQQRKHPDRSEQFQSDDSDDSQYGDGDEYAEVQSDDSDDSKYDGENAREEDDHEEIRVITDNTECVDGSGENRDILCGGEYADYGMDLGLNNEGENHSYIVEEIVNYQSQALWTMIPREWLSTWTTGSTTA